jgi:hypothetical protein
MDPAAAYLSGFRIHLLFRLSCGSLAHTALLNVLTLLASNLGICRYELLNFGAKNVNASARYTRYIITYLILGKIFTTMSEYDTTNPLLTF